jgi:hypothetical protein
MVVFNFRLFVRITADNVILSRQLLQPGEQQCRHAQPALSRAEKALRLRFEAKVTRE